MNALMVQPVSVATGVFLKNSSLLSLFLTNEYIIYHFFYFFPNVIKVQRAISPEREILSIMETWFDKPGARFIFQIKLYTATLTNSTDPKVIHMMFIQAVYNVITGIYPSNEKEAVSLAALQFQAKFGLHNSASHKPGFLKNLISEFVPAAHMDSEPKQTIETWEQKIFYKHAFSTTTTPREGYLDLLKKRDYYGAVFFAVKQRFSRNIPKRIYMTISRKGIMLFKVPVKVTDSDFEKIGSYNLADIYRWAYKPNVNFYFEVKDEGAATNPIFTFDTQEGKHMSDMLTDYAMALLREMGLNPDGTRRNKPKSKAEIEAAAANAAVTAASASVDGSEGKATWGEGIDAASAEGAAAEVIPTKSAMATSEEAYAEVGGEVAALATAAVRSGEYTETLPPGSPAQAGQPPPPPLSLSEEGGAQEASSSLSATEAIQATTAETAEVALPAGWIKVTDEASGQPYFFNEGTGVSVWDPKECT
jgi:hypothetical protein